MGVFVKICGIGNASDCEAVAELCPDAMGFIFFLLPFFRFLGLDIPYQDDGIALQRAVGLGDLE